MSWLVVGTQVGADGMGYVVAYLEYPTEYEARLWEGRRGETCDAMKLFLGEPIPEDFSIEITSADEYYADYGNRMPLRNKMN